MKNQDQHPLRDRAEPYGERTITASEQHLRPKLAASAGLMGQMPYGSNGKTGYQPRAGSSFDRADAARGSNVAPTRPGFRTTNRVS